MGHEVGNRHLPAGDERCVSGKEPDRDQKPRDNFDYASDAEERAEQRRGSFAVETAEPAKNLLRAVTGEEQTNHYAHQRVSMWRKIAKDLFHGEINPFLVFFLRAPNES